MLTATAEIAAKSRVAASREELKTALEQLRAARSVRSAGRGTFSLTARGHEALRLVRLNRARDKVRLYRLRNSARGH